MIGRRTIGKNRYFLGSLLTVILSLATFALAQDQGREFHWTGKLTPDQIVEIKNLNGKIEARGDNSSDEVEVTAEKSGPDADLVKIEVVPHAEGVTICAIYSGGSLGAKTGPCEPGEKMAFRQSQQQGESRLHRSRPHESSIRRDLNQR
jgi:hypothetical protein